VKKWEVKARLFVILRREDAEGPPCRNKGVLRFAQDDGSEDHDFVSFVHARRVAALSWPLYLGGLSVVIGSSLVMAFTSNAFLGWGAALAIFVALWFMTASFLAFHAMFDSSDLLRGTWLPQLFAAPPKRWVQITTSLDQTRLPLESLFPDAEGRVIDVYDPRSTTEPALARARRDVATQSGSRISDVGDGWAELVLIMLSAHEIRDPKERDRLFHEVARALAPEGRVVLVEHLRDLAAVLAFGPGAWHFFPRKTWLEHFASSRFVIQHEFPITPFVRVFELKV